MQPEIRYEPALRQHVGHTAASSRRQHPRYISGALPRYRNIVFGAANALICVIEFRQYIILFVHYPPYELVTEGLLRALQILKPH